MAKNIRLKNIGGCQLSTSAGCLERLETLFNFNFHCRDKFPVELLHYIRIQQNVLWIHVGVVWEKVAGFLLSSR